MKNKMDELKSFVKTNQKKLGIAFLSLLGLCILTSGAWYGQMQSKEKELAETTISKVKEEKEVKKEKTSSQKKEAKENTQKDKAKAEDKKEPKQNKKEATKSEEKGSTVVIESEAKKDTSQEATKEKKQTKVETKVESKPAKVNATTPAKAVTPAKKEENKPVSQPIKPAEVKPNTPAPQKQETKKDPNEGKEWREAEYRTIQVPAVTERRWIVDETAWTEQVMVGTVWVAPDGTRWVNDSEFFAYIEKLALSGDMRSYWTEPVYETVNHPEVGHWEDVVITPATTRQELVREAGWY